MLNKLFDLIVVLLVIPVFFIPSIVISILILITSRGPILYWSERIGKDSIVFLMPKFRTMYIETPNKSSELLKNPTHYITSIGSFLRKYSLDELPQIFSIMNGKMSIVGPRPALYNQSELIALRKKYKIDKVLPGITGWAQINGRDKITTDQKIVLDLFYIKNRSIFLDVKILLKTFFVVLKKSNVSH